MKLHLAVQKFQLALVQLGSEKDKCLDRIILNNGNLPCFVPEQVAFLGSERALHTGIAQDGIFVVLLII